MKKLIVNVFTCIISICSFNYDLNGKSKLISKLLVPIRFQADALANLDKLSSKLEGVSSKFRNEIVYAVEIEEVCISYETNDGTKHEEWFVLPPKTVKMNGPVTGTYLINNKLGKLNNKIISLWKESKPKSFKNSLARASLDIQQIEGYSSFKFHYRMPTTICSFISKWPI